MAGAVSNPTNADSNNFNEKCDSNIQLTILDILNSYCLNHIFSFVPVKYLIASQRVSKQWFDAVDDYLRGYRTFKMSWWPGLMSNADLHKFLSRYGKSLWRLHIEYEVVINTEDWHKFGSELCPNLKELKIVDDNYRDFCPLIFGAKNLKQLYLNNCQWRAAQAVDHLVKSDFRVEHLTVAFNSLFKGNMLAANNPQTIKYLAFYHCENLKFSNLISLDTSYPYLTTLKIDFCTSICPDIPQIISRLPQLEELSISEYYLGNEYPNVEIFGLVDQQYNIEELCEALSKLTSLKKLNMRMNRFVTNEVIKQIALSCRELEELDISNSVLWNRNKVDEEGVSAVCLLCECLVKLNVSYLHKLTGEGLAAATGLETLIARGVPTLTTASLVAFLLACPALTELDVCGCRNITSELVSAAVTALQRDPRPLLLHLAGTSVRQDKILPKHPLLTVDMVNDRCEYTKRPVCSFLVKP